MKIAVCMKWVPDLEIPEIVNSATGTIDEVLAEYRLDGSSIAALEMALQVKAAKQAELVVVSIAPEEANAALQEVYALGADRVIRIWHENLEAADAYVKGLTLSTLLRELAPELIFCGARSGDTGSGQLPAVLAEMLDFAQVTDVASEIELKNQQSLVAFRRLEQGAREQVEVELPAVVAVDQTATGMPYAPLGDYLAAKEKTVESIDVFDLGLAAFDVSSWSTKSRLVSVSQPLPVSQAIYTPPSELEPLDRIRAIVSGGLEQKTGEIAQAGAEELAEKAFQFLLQNGFL